MLISYETFFSFAAANYLLVVHEKTRRKKIVRYFKYCTDEGRDLVIVQLIKLLLYSNFSSSLGKARILVEKLILDF